MTKGPDEWIGRKDRFLGRVAGLFPFLSTFPSLIWETSKPKDLSGNSRKEPTLYIGFVRFPVTLVPVPMGQAAKVRAWLVVRSVGYVGPVWFPVSVLSCLALVGLDTRPQMGPQGPRGAWVPVWGREARPAGWGG